MDSLATIVAKIDARVPRKRNEMAWRLAFFKRFETNLIKKGDKAAMKNWDELADNLQWEDAASLKDHCNWKIERAFENSGLEVVNIFALLQVTFGVSKSIGLETSILAV